MKFIDPTGRTLELTGSDADDLVNELKAKTGYTLKRDKNTGKIAIDKSAKRQTKGTSKELAKELKKVIDDTHTVSIDVGHNQTQVFFDDFLGQQIDMADYKAINNQYPSLAASLLGHVFGEYLAAASSGQGATRQSFGSAHTAGLSEESQVMSDYTHATENPRLDHIAGNTVTFIYCSVQFDVTVKTAPQNPTPGPIKKTP
jgi:hypothetical protein